MPTTKTTSSDINDAHNDKWIFGGRVLRSSLKVYCFLSYSLYFFQFSTWAKITQKNNVYLTIWKEGSPKVQVNSNS